MLKDGCGKSVVGTCGAIQEAIEGSTSIVLTDDENVAIALSEESSVYEHGREITVSREYPELFESYDADTEMKEALQSFINLVEMN